MISQSIIILDTETTGFSPAQGAELLQVSICDFDGDVIYDQYCKPNSVTEWPGAMEVNGITPDMVADKPSPETLREEIQTVVDRAKIVVGHNIQFDLRFLQAIGVDFTGKEIVDTMEIARSTTLAVANNKLGTLAEHFHFQFDAHNAAEDIRATAHVYKCLLTLNAAAQRRFQETMGCPYTEPTVKGVYRTIRG